MLRTLVCEGGRLDADGYALRLYLGPVNYRTQAPKVFAKRKMLVFLSSDALSRKKSEFGISSTFRRIPDSTNRHRFVVSQSAPTVRLTNGMTILQKCKLQSASQGMV